MATAYETEHQTLSTSIVVLEQDLAKNADAVSGVDKFIAIVKKHIAINELTPSFLRELMGKIVIHEKGAGRQEIVLRIDTQNAAEIAKTLESAGFKVDDVRLHGS
jgi:hypothetical protein